MCSFRAVSLLELGLVCFGDVSKIKVLLHVFLVTHFVWYVVEGGSQNRSTVYLTYAYMAIPQPVQNRLTSRSSLGKKQAQRLDALATMARGELAPPPA